MRTSAFKIIFLVNICFLTFAELSQAAPSRFECLERIGNSATKEQLDACVSGGLKSAPGKTQTSNSPTASEEATCSDMGFKRKTESFGNCVLELLDRKSNAFASNNPDDATCRKYGFKPRTNEYATCRLQIDQAKQDAQRQQAQFAEQQKQYEAQIEEQKRQRKIASGIALMQMGAGLSSGAYNPNNAYGALPTPPNPNRTYVLPGGKMMNCTTTGSVTQCF